jgi:hypothetical protein
MVRQLAKKELHKSTQAAITKYMMARKKATYLDFVPRGHVSKHGAEAVDVADTLASLPCDVDDGCITLEAKQHFLHSKYGRARLPPAYDA